MAQHNETGNAGEEAALAFLVNKGYKLLAKNWRHRRNEIDIIARDGDEIVFVEVKTRSSDYMGSPSNAVTPSKQKTLIKTANEYLLEADIELDARFDIIAIVENKNGMQLEHFEGAFSPRW